MVLRTFLSCFPVIIQSGRSMPLVLRELLERWHLSQDYLTVFSLLLFLSPRDFCIGTAEGQSKGMHQCLENIAISGWFINAVFPKSVMMCACGGVTLCTNKPKWRCFVCTLFLSSPFRKILFKFSFIWFLGSTPQIRALCWFILGYTLHKWRHDEQRGLPVHRFWHASLYLSPFPRMTLLRSHIIAKSINDLEMLSSLIHFVQALWHLSHFN